MNKTPTPSRRAQNPVCLRLVKARDKQVPWCKSLVDDSQKSEVAFWKMWEHSTTHQSAHAQRWWISTGPVLAVLLQNADYHLVDQWEILLFYRIVLAPELGPYPDILGNFPHWKSFMTDDGMPIELSWDWGVGGNAPLVRLSIEPIGLQAGTLHDPLNRFATDRVVQNFGLISPSSDLRLFHHFSKELLAYEHKHEVNNMALSTAEHQSRSFVAFDFGKTGIMLKAYFIPKFSPQQASECTLGLISGAMAQVDQLEAVVFPAYDLLLEHVQASALTFPLEAEMLSIDCVKPTSARIKLYLRCQATSFESVSFHMTLGGRLKLTGLDKGIQELEKLWRMVLPSAPDSSTNEELPHKSHRTAGILYYYDFKSQQLAPNPRVYIPVRHYGDSDMAVAERLGAYLAARGQNAPVRRYMEALQTI